MNIFLVEDERWALAEMVELFKTYEPQHRVSAFDNGDDALSAAGRMRPDLVLTDINMPGIDGLELIEKLNELDPTIKSMIVSVHDQFEYARQGMKFGVFDYLLKPVKKEALYKAVDTAIQHIETDSKRRQEWKNGTLAQMLLSAEIPEHTGMRKFNEAACCMVLLIMDSGEGCKGWKDTPFCLNDFKEQLARGYASFDRLESLQREEIHCIDLDCQLRVGLLPETAFLEEERLVQMLTLMHRQLQQLPVRVHLAYGVKLAKRTLYDTFSELKRHMDEQMIFGQPTFLSPGMSQQDAELSGVWDKVRIMESHFKQGSVAKGQAALRLILEDLRHKQITKRQLRLFIGDMLFSLKYNLLASKIGSAGINDLQEDTGRLNRLAGYEELYEWLDEKIVSLYCGQEQRDVNPKGLIPLLLRQIHTNYRDTISLQQFAADHHVSLGYLSRMFKSQTGYTFSDYIAGYRIRKAQELLCGGIERLQEVSHLVGYEDTKHFSALFKKIVGEAPISYARRHAGK